MYWVKAIFTPIKSTYSILFMSSSGVGAVRGTEDLLMYFDVFSALKKNIVLYRLNLSPRKIKACIEKYSAKKKIMSRAPKTSNYPVL